MASQKTRDLRGVEWWDRNKDIEIQPNTGKCLILILSSTPGTVHCIVGVANLSLVN